MRLSKGKSKIHCSAAGESCCVLATRLWAALGVEQRGAECPTQRSGPFTVPRTQHGCWPHRVTTVHRITVVCVPGCDPPRCHRPSQTTPWILVTAETCSTPGVHLHIEGPWDPLLGWAGPISAATPRTRHSTGWTSMSGVVSQCPQCPTGAESPYNPSLVTGAGLSKYVGFGKKD